MRENLKEIDPQGHATEIFSDWAIRYLSDMKQKQEPFFLYLAYNAPHTPIQPPQEWLEKVKKREPSLPEKRAKIVALIEHLDYNVGRVYEALEQNGQLENTIIIFTSDNGGQDDAGANNGPFRGAKQDMYEGGIRVAGGIYWKNQIRPAVRDNFVMLSDMFPTLCLFCGVRNKIPEIEWCIGYEGKVIPDMEVRHITHLNTGISRFYKILLGSLSNSLI